MLSRFHLIPERYGHFGQTDRQICYINIAVSMLTRDKNVVATNTANKLFK